MRNDVLASYYLKRKLIKWIKAIKETNKNEKSTYNIKKTGKYQIKAYLNMIKIYNNISIILKYHLW